MANLKSAALGAACATAALAWAGAPAGAAVPVASITTCDSAVAAMNAGLSAVARTRLALAAAKSTHDRATIARAQKRYARAQAQRDAIRAKITALCGEPGVSTRAATCAAAIDRLGAAIDALAAARARLAVAGLTRNRRAQLRARAGAAEAVARTRVDAMHEACTPPQPVRQPAAPAGPSADTTPPSVTIGVQTPTNDTTPAVQLAASEDAVSFSCALDGGAEAAEPSAFDLPQLADGTHTLACRGADSAGNTGALVSRQIVIDTVAPPAPLVTGAVAVSIAANPATGGTIKTWIGPNPDAATGECRIDGGAWQNAPGLEFTHTYTPGSYAIECRLTDAAGNHGTAAPLIGGPLVVTP